MTPAKHHTDLKRPGAGWSKAKEGKGSPAVPGCLRDSTAGCPGLRQSSNQEMGRGHCHQREWSMLNNSGEAAHASTGLKALVLADAMLFESLPSSPRSKAFAFCLSILTSVARSAPIWQRHLRHHQPFRLTKHLSSRCNLAESSLFEESVYKLPRILPRWQGQLLSQLRQMLREKRFLWLHGSWQGACAL